MTLILPSKKIRTKIALCLPFPLLAWSKSLSQKKVASQWQGSQPVLWMKFKAIDAYKTLKYHFNEKKKTHSCLTGCKQGIALNNKQTFFSTVQKWKTHTKKA